MDIRKIQKLIELLEHSQIAEVEIREGEESVRITRMPPVAPSPASWPAPVYQPAPPPAPPPLTVHLPEAAPAAAAVAEAPATTGKPAVDLAHCITSPMVGTFYLSTAPGQPPLAQVGSRIKRGDTVCIVEAMKIMNPIEADNEGTVVAVLVENGHPVEFGQPLFQLAP
jgi:acetyl-CoA carboxylase biotin carboxyl carrier protein